MPPSADTPHDLARRIASGERRALAKAITLVESGRSDHRARAAAVLAALPPPAAPARRIGLSGTPGVGKSTFIETLGLTLARAGERVAVLAVDPSSSRSGGSILGDKTRMPDLARHPNAYIRPTPSLGMLGGVGRRTRETIRLVEAAGFGTVLVETVGVGQSETMVAEITDIFLLLLAPGGGDELQGVKRGIMEMADLIVINKADGALKGPAEATRADYSGALTLMRRRARDPEGIPAALAVSARTGDGIEPLWTRIVALWDWRRSESWLARHRADQAVQAMRRQFEQTVLERIYRDAATEVRAAETAAARGDADPDELAEALAARVLPAPPD